MFSESSRRSLLVLLPFPKQIKSLHLQIVQQFHLRSQELLVGTRDTWIRNLTPELEMDMADQLILMDDLLAVAETATDLDQKKVEMVCTS